MVAIVESLSPTLLDITAGILLHLLVLRHGEWDFVLPVLIVKVVAVWVPLLALGALMPHTRLDIFWAMLSAINFHALRVTAGLCISILIYRWQFHPLGRFPGPPQSRLSNVYIMWKSAKSTNAFEMVADYHQQYGDFVRVGKLYGLFR
jgi:hypothetical protein